MCHHIFLILRHIINVIDIETEVKFMDYHFLKVCTVTPKMHLADCNYNIQEIIQTMKEATQNGANLAVYPELCVTGYSCGDLFHQSNLIHQVECGMMSLLEETKNLDLIAVVGVPITIGNGLYNTAVVVHKGKILGIVPKTYLPNYGEFYEKRWFSAAHNLSQSDTVYAGQHCLVSPHLLFKCNSLPYFTFGIDICEDLWATAPPSLFHSLLGATVLVNLSASNETIGKSQYRKDMIAQHSAKTMSAYLYTSSGVNESTTDLVFSGHQLIYENGYLLNESPIFLDTTNITYGIIDLERLHKQRIHQNNISPTQLLEHLNYQTILFDLVPSSFNFDRFIDSKPFVPQDEQHRKERCKDIFDIQAHGLARRAVHAKSDYLIFGMSGGLDSTLALIVCVKAAKYANMERSQILGVTMPGFGTSNRTYQNAINLMNLLGITVKEISIVEATEQHLKDIEHPLEQHDVTYENAQARERTQILMDLANKYNGLVVGTADLSELALGWATFNGDHMSMYNVNSGVPKTLVRYLLDYVAHYESEPLVQEILFDVLETPVSPELLPTDASGDIAQKTEDLVGPYELHDFYIYYVLRFGYSPKKVFFLADQAFKGQFDRATIFKWLYAFYTRFFKHQFKRSSMPDGPKIGSICLSPRGDLRMPSDAYSDLWLNELDQLKTELKL